jgi:acid phosphatase family membrane protein YuiD
MEKFFEWFLCLFRNPFVITAASAWFVSQTLKIFTHAIAHKEFQLKRFFGDGGMPSSHTATVASLAGFSALAYGLDSFQFAISVILTIIVCKDAVGVRQETGKQSLIINELKHMIESKEITDIELKKFVGHTPLQVLYGLGVGLTMAAIMFFFVFN